MLICFDKILFKINFYMLFIELIILFFKIRLIIIDNNKLFLFIVLFFIGVIKIVIDFIVYM